MFTSTELYEITGLNTDGVSGFEAQLREKTYKREALWPEHLVGKRVDDFCEGSRLARNYLATRAGQGQARRSIRHANFRDEGATSCFVPQGKERKEEQLSTLRSVCELRARIKAKLDAEAVQETDA